MVDNVMPLAIVYSLPPALLIPLCFAIAAPKRV